MQVESARKIYDGASHPSTRTSVLPGLAPWIGAGLERHRQRGADMYAADAYKYVITKDRDWDPLKFNPATDLDLALAAGS